MEWYIEIFCALAAYQIFEICVCYDSRFRLATAQVLHSPVGLMATLLDSASPGAVCSRELCGLLWLHGISLPGLTLHLHTYSDSLLVQTAKILAITLFGMEAMWAKPGLGFATCFHFHFFFLPLVSPGCPKRGGEWGGGCWRFLLCSGLGGRTEMEKCEEFSLKQKSCLALGLPTRLPQRRARSWGPGAWTSRELEMHEGSEEKPPTLGGWRAFMVIPWTVVTEAGLTLS